MEINLEDLPDQSQPEHNYPDVVAGRVAHIDADFMAYQVSAERKEELDGTRPRRSLKTMRHNAEKGLIHLMRCAGADSFVAHITPSASTKGDRDAIALTKGYQANRSGVEKPEHLQAIRAFIGTELPSAVHYDQEADDGMTQANYAAIAAGTPELSVIVSKDKDLRMAPGLHYDFDDDCIVDVDDPFGDIWVDRSKKTAKVLGWGTKFFWAQTLMGDTADNIQGLPSTVIDGKTVKVGPIKAYKLLEDCKDDKQCFELVKKLWKASEHEWCDYRMHESDDPLYHRHTTWNQHLLSDMQLLWMRRSPDPLDVAHWLKEVHE